MDREQIKQTIASCEFFEKLADDETENIVSLCREMSFPVGACVFQQGDYGEHIYIIAEGQVVLERAVDLGVRKGTVPIEALGRGRVLGSWATLLGQPHRLMSSAVCQKPTLLLVMRGADLRTLMLRDKNLGFNVMEKFCFLLKDRIQAAYGAMEKI